MKKLSRVLTVCLCSAPLLNFGAHAVVATNAGHNLTAYNPSNTYNNQWNTLVNGRSDLAQPNARADFGNCNAIVMRCASPKCANGGCVDANVATAIVAGCVESNASCKQYGNELVSYMAAQLVANSTARANEQQAAANAAAQSAQSEQMAAQIAQMQSSMQQQMAQMQQQMAAQNAQTQRQLQDALAEQREQNAAAIENLTSAANTVNTVNTIPVSTMDLTATQTNAIDDGISAEILLRQQATGKIMTEIEDADVSLAEVKKSMSAAFEYAGCDSHGNNCSGPKRVKKFRELALDFIDPYDNVADKIYDALDDASLVGVDITPIYMMLSDSCKEWANFLCQYKPNGELFYDDGVPMVCDKAYKDCKSGDDCKKQYLCTMCTVNKKLTNDDEIYGSWIEEGMSADDGRKNNSVVVGCASKLVERSGFLGRRAKRKNGAGLVDIDFLSTWLTQTEPNVKPSDANKHMYDSCYNAEAQNVLETARLSKTISTKSGQRLCVKERGSVSEDETCPFVNPIYALCDTHVYNIGKSENSTSYRDEMAEMIGLKTTVVAQQMYKQYEYLAATLRRLKTHLEKAVFQATLEASGAKKDDDSTGSSWSTSRADKEEGIYLSNAMNCYTGDTDSMVRCLNSNLDTITSSMKNKTKDACRQLTETIDTAQSLFTQANTTIEGNNKIDIPDDCKYGKDKANKLDKAYCNGTKNSDIQQTIRKCTNQLRMSISTAKNAIERDKNRSYRDYR